MLKNKKPTLTDVANRAGVSTATASKALLGGKGKTIRVGASTIERVRKAARELQYVPNSTARNLATSKTGFIAYLLSDSIAEGLNNSFFNRYLTGVESSVRKHGYGLYVAQATLSDIKKVIFPEKLRQRSVDGIIAVGQIPEEVFEEFERYHLPTIFLNRAYDVDYRYATFCVTTCDAHKKIVEYGHSLGHSRFWACVGPKSALYPQLLETRVELEKKLADCSIVFMNYPEPAFDEQSYAEWLLASWRNCPNKEKPSFLYGSPKHLTRLLGGLSDIGIRCPEDISAMACGDLEMNRYFHPALSCVEYDYESIGSDAVDLLVRYIEKPTTDTHPDKEKVQEAASPVIPLEESRKDYCSTIIERKSVKRYELD